MFYYSMGQSNSCQAVLTFSTLLVLYADVSSLNNVDAERYCKSPADSIPDMMSGSLSVCTYYIMLKIKLIHFKNATLHSYWTHVK